MIVAALSLSALSRVGDEMQRKPLKLRAGFLCGSAARLSPLERHHYHSDRGSSWNSEAAAHRELSL